MSLFLIFHVHQDTEILIILCLGFKELDQTSKKLILWSVVWLLLPGDVTSECDECNDPF